MLVYRKIIFILYLIKLYVNLKKFDTYQFLILIVIIKN